MAVRVGQDVMVAMQGGLKGVVEETRPGQVLVRLEDGSKRWVASSQVRAVGLPLFSSRPPSTSTAPSARPPQAHDRARGGYNPYSPPAAQPQSQWSTGAEMTWRQWFFSFEGRISRSKYWGGLFVLWGSILALGIGSSLLIFAVQKALGGGETDTTPPPTPSPQDSEPTAAMLAVIFIPVLLFVGLLLWTTFALQVKRWHDRNKSGLWVLVSFIPFIGELWAFIECGCLRGTIGDNNYGPDPLP